MIGLDTNVVVRVLVGDDAGHVQAARALLDSLTPAQPGWISQVALAETFWVLHRGYKHASEDIWSAIRRLIHADDLVVEHHDLVVAALDDAARGADFADALIARGGQRAGARTTMTFDADAAGSLDGMELLEA